MDTLYANGTILTMEAYGRAEAVLCRDGLIAATGPLEELEALARNPRRVDLQRHTLLPAFLDPHSHFVGLGGSMGTATLAGCESFDEIIASLKAFAATGVTPPGKALMGGGYDHTALKEGRHPDRWVLDAAFPDTPVLISHVSNHMAVVNSLGLRRLGIPEDAPDPEGGHFGRDGQGRLTGYLEERAYLQFTGRAAPPAPALVERGQEVYLSHGILTIQDGMTRPGEWSVLKTLADAHKLKADVVAYVDVKDHRALLRENRAYVGAYRDRLRIGGYKVFLDGSPQARTAWLTAPYEGEADDRGYPICTDAQVAAYARAAVEDGVQFLAHCNGDQACQQFLDACAGAEGIAPLRPVMVHAQTLRPDQLPRLKALGVIPSYFTAHTYFWGDVHLRNLGARAQSISPAGSTLRAGLPYTFHQDTPVLPPDMLSTVWCAVNRVTRSGEVLGPQERLTAEQALRGITRYAAYQYGEEARKGSLRPGKRADLVVLDRDPTAVDPMEIKDIRVLETIRSDQSVWHGPAGSLLS